MAIVCAALALTPVAPARADAPRASLPDIEREVMCPTCGVPLEQAFSPQAERQRHFIRRQIDRGRTKQQIKNALVAEFGPDVLAAPRESGFELTAYVVPIVVACVALLLISFGLMRWRRRPPADPTAETSAQIAPADASRIERDLSRHDL
ncbi:MAG: cytochrome c-type biogenesis protein CcmH [Solirubrobacterales bacterium]